MEPLSSPFSPGKETKKAEKESKETSDLSASTARISTSAADIISKPEESTPSPIKEKEVKEIADKVTPKEAIDCLTSFLNVLIADLESKQKETTEKPYDIAIEGIKEIISKVETDLSGTLIPIEQIRKRVLLARIQLINLLVSNFSWEELLKIKIPGFQGPRWLQQNSKYLSEKDKADLTAPKPLFNIFDNLHDRIVLKKQFQTFVASKNSFGIERCIEESIRKNLPDLALGFTASLPSEKVGENVGKVIHYYMYSYDLVDFQKAIELAKTYSETGRHHQNLSSEILFSSHRSVERIKILLEAVSTLPQGEEKYFCLRNIILNLLELNDLQQAKRLVPELIENIKVAFNRDPDLKHYHLALSQEMLIKLGMINEIVFDVTEWNLRNKAHLLTNTINSLKEKGLAVEKTWDFEVLKGQTILQYLKKDPKLWYHLIKEKVLQIEQITDEQDRKQIVMIVLEEASKLFRIEIFFTKKLPSYEFKDTSCYVDIIKRAASLEPKITSKYLANFYKVVAIDKKDKLEIAKAIFLKSPAYKFVNDSPINNPHLIFDIPPKDFLDLLEPNIAKYFPPNEHEILSYFFSNRPLIPDLFKDLLEQANAEKNPIVKESLTNWVNRQKVNYQALVFLYNTRKIDVRKELDALKTAYGQLYKYRAPQDREEISKVFFQFMDPDFLKRWLEEINSGVKTPLVHTMVPIVLALQCTEDKATLTEFNKDLRKERDTVREAKTMHLLGSFLLELSNSGLSVDQKTLLVAQIFVEKGKALAPRLRSLNLFLNLRKGDLIAGPNVSNAQLQEIIQKFISSAFRLNIADFGGSDKFNELYHDRVESKFRDKDALLVFAGKINELASPAKEAMQAAYSKFVGSLLKNEFYQLRRQSPQLRELKDDELGQRVAKSWNEFPPFKQLETGLAEKSSEKEPFPQKFKSFLSQRLIHDKHLRDDKNIDKFPTLLPYLFDFLTKEKETNAESLLKEISREKQSPQLELQQCCLELYLSKDIDDALLTRLENIVKTLKEKEKDVWDEFLRDIEGFITKLKAEQKGAMTIGITNDPCDLLVLARETNGCQSIDGTPSLNKSALAYVIDGKNAAIVIKGNDGKIKARAVLRLLLDEKTKNPVLFIERHYFKVDDPNLRIALNNYAINYAKELSLPLLTIEALPSTIGCKEYGPIISLGSNAPYEYSDAVGGQNTGKFTVPKSYVMYEPVLLVP